MKYIAFVIGGLIFGVYSNDGWGVWVGGVIGFLIAWISNLSQQLSQLESKFLKIEAKQKFSTNIASASQPDTPVKPQQGGDSKEDNLPDSDLVSTTAAAMRVKRDSELAVEQKPSEQQMDASIDQPVSSPSKADIEDQLAAAKQMDGFDENKQYKADDELVPELMSEMVSELGGHDKSTVTAKPAKPVYQEPSWLETTGSRLIKQAKSYIVGYFTGGNSLVRVGMLVLFVGVAFLLKYVAERTVVPVEVRYVGIVLGSLVLLGLGWRLRNKRPGFALSLQGGGIGVLYLTLFAAMRLHQLLPPNVVLVLLVVIVALSAIMAILQDAVALAVIGILGGFAAPILTSTGSGSHAQLFAYYLLLNFSIFGIAWFKSWRLLNVVGFVSTFAVGSIWGVKFYQPQFFASVEPFLIAHFLLYVSVAVLFAFKQPPKLKGINDGTIIFGTPIVVFSLQAALVKDIEFGLAYSALALGVFYIAVAYLVKMLHRPFFKDLIESFIALGVGFGTLAIPLGFDGRVTSAMWVAEAAAMVWVGIKQSRVLPRFSGYALALLGSLAFFVEPEVNKKVLAFLNADFIGVLIITLATVFMGLYARRHQDRLLKLETPWVSHLMLLAAVSWWVLGGLHEIDKHFRASAYFLQQLWLLGTTLVLVFSSYKLNYALLMRCALLVNAIMWPLLFYFSHYTVEKTMFLNERFIGLVIVALFYIAMSVFWAKHLANQNETIKKNSKFRYLISRYFLTTGVITWLFAIFIDMQKFIPAQQMLWVQMMMASTAAVLLWLGHKQRWYDFRWAALGVVFAMAMPLYLGYLMTQYSTTGSITGEGEAWPILNVYFLAMLIYAVTHFLMARYWQLKMVKSSAISKTISSILLILSLLAWFMNGVFEALAFLEAPHWLPTVLVFISASWLLLVLLAHRLDWADLHKVKYVATPMLVYWVVFTPTIQTFHASFGLLAWLMAFGVNYWLLKVYDNKLAKVSDAFHVISLLSLSMLLMYELTQLIEWQIGKSNIWHNSAAALMLLLVISLVFVLRNRISWPLMAHRRAYFYWALPIMMGVLWLLLLGLNLSDPGGLAGLPYLPVLNVIDLVGIAGLYLAFQMQRSADTKLFINDKRIRYSLLAAMGFLMLNASMLRCFHYWLGIDYKWNDLLSSFVVQTGFSILWAAAAVTLMVLAAHKKWRPVWLLGLGLMIAVVAKLFLVDMSASGSIERIVAFLTVGVLLSVVGYFSPLPPEADSAAVNTSNDEAVEPVNVNDTTNKELKDE